MTTWFEYLKAAHPAAAGKLTTDTVAVYETQFADVAPARMMRVAAEAVRRSKWFPSVNELRAIVAEFEEAADLAEARAWRAAAEREKQRRERAGWPVCDTCGEHTPSVEDCPFCADMAEMDMPTMYEELTEVVA